jgi:hypothetical protein
VEVLKSGVKTSAFGRNVTAIMRRVKDQYRRFLLTPSALHCRY